MTTLTTDELRLRAKAAAWIEERERVKWVWGRLAAQENVTENATPNPWLRMGLGQSREEKCNKK